MAVVVSRRIFGGSVYSTTHSRQLKMVGTGKRRLTEIIIDKAHRKIRLPNGMMRADIVPGYMPKSAKEAYHPGCNSACFMIQTAHLMGCNPIYLVGFTLKTGSSYFFGDKNPVTRRHSIYDEVVPLHWLKWYQSKYPGRVQLWPGWDGPIYEVFDEARYESNPDRRNDDEEE